MQSLDFTRLLDGHSFEALMPPYAYPVEGLYPGADGIQFRSRGEHPELVQEIVRLGEGAFLFASNHSPLQSRSHSQVINGSDWIHIQVRMCGGGSERLCPAEPIHTPERSCIISRYPQSSTIERQMDGTERWKAVCLLATPTGLARLLDLAAPALPGHLSWLALPGLLEARTHILPLQPAMSLVAGDILCCTFRGPVRRAYMRAKALELLSTVIHVLEGTTPESARTGIRLSPADLGKLARARTLMNEDLESPFTLAQLAQRVGLNRTKLALGFKSVYGVSVQAYWRDARLLRARELLSQGGARVTEVALDIGYAELSSFTRAFTRKFGVLPRDCRAEHVPAPVRPPAQGAGSVRTA